MLCIDIWGIKCVDRNRKCMYYKNKNGFIGLLVLLIALAIIVVLWVKFYFTAEQEGLGTEVENLLPERFDESIPQTRYEQLDSAKSAAESVQGIVDMEGKKIEDAL